MGRFLISSDNSLFENVAGIALAMLLIPIAIVAKLIAMPFERPTKRSPTEVLSFLSNFRDEMGNDYDWDDFISVPIADPELESIRADAASLDLPTNAEELNNLRALIAKTEAIVSRRPAP